MMNEMENEQLLERITINPQVLVGKPTIRNRRYSVAMIIDELAGRGERRGGKGGCGAG